MKKLFSAVALLGLLVSCDELKKLTDTLELGIGDVTISADGGSETVWFTPIGDWTATADQSWVNIDPTKGGVGQTGDIQEASITIEVGVYGNSSPRTAKVTITMGGETGSFKVIQQGADGDNPGGGPKPLICVVSNTTHEVDSGAQSIRILIDSEYESAPYVENLSNWPDWINVSKPKKYFIDDAEEVYGEYYESMVTLKPNTSGSARACGFTYRGSIEGKSIQSQLVTIVQKAPNGGGDEKYRQAVVMKDGVTTYDYNGYGAKKFDVGVVTDVIQNGVLTEYGYTEVVPYADQWPDWITVSKDYTSEWRYTSDLMTEDHKAKINTHVVSLTRNTPDSDRSFSFVFRGKIGDETVESKPISVKQFAASNADNSQVTTMFVCSTAGMGFEFIGVPEQEIMTASETLDVFKSDVTFKVESNRSWIDGAVTGSGDQRTLTLNVNVVQGLGQTAKVVVTATDSADKKESYEFEFSVASRG